MRQHGAESDRRATRRPLRPRYFAPPAMHRFFYQLPRARRLLRVERVVMRLAVLLGTCARSVYLIIQAVHIRQRMREAKSGGRRWQA